MPLHEISFAVQAYWASKIISKHNSTVPVLRRIIGGGGQIWSGAVLLPYKGFYVADIGAYRGYYTVLASFLVGPAGHVYSFEPEEIIINI